MTELKLEARKSDCVVEFEFYSLLSLIPFLNCCVLKIVLEGEHKSVLDEENYSYYARLQL